MNKTVTLLFFILMILLVIVINKPSGLDQDLIDLDNRYKHQLDSITAIYTDSLHKRELVALKAFTEAQSKVNRLEGEVSHWKIKYNHEKNNNRSFSDAGLDSLIQSIR